jgi:hypothetical protein
MTRDQFRSMPPMRHDRDPTKSAVLAHISATIACDLTQAARTFHYLRNKGHLHFQKAGRLWMGVDHAPEESEAQFRARMCAENTFLHRRIGQLEHLVDKLRASHNELIKRISSG